MFGDPELTPVRAGFDHPLFRFRVLKRPEWARLSTPEIRAESITGVVISVTADAPAGKQTAEFQLEISNLHTPDGQNLVVSASLSLDIQK